MTKDETLALCDKAAAGCDPRSVPLLIEAIYAALEREEQLGDDVNEARRNWCVEVSELQRIRDESGDRIDVLEAAVARLTAERDLANRAIRNLVAVIDHDGGERQAGESPTETSERARAAVCAERTESEAVCG